MSIFDTLKRKIRKAYWFASTYGQHLPLAVEAIARFRCHVKLLHGPLRGRSESIRLLYVGRGRNFSYLSKSVFEDYAVARAAVRTIFSYRKTMDAMAAEADVVILDIGWPYHRALERTGEYAVVPDWISMTVEFPDRWEEVVANFRRTARKHDLRLIRRNGYQYDCLRDRRSMEKFYDEMHEPFVRKRHGGDSAIAPRRHVVRRGTQGCLLHITKDRQVVAAGIIYPEDDIMYSLWLGLPPEHLDAPPEAAFSALYYFGMQQTFEQGFRYFDFGGTRALLNDGAFQFKRRWGPLIEDWFSPSSILLRPAPTAGGLAFCRAVPVIRRSAAGLEGLIVCDSGDANPAMFERLEKEYGCKGIDRITVIAVGGEQDARCAAGEPQDRERRVLHCGPAQFVDHYTSAARVPKRREVE